jgi:gamma-glutamyltranspeptidase/glutathione hydrolase
MAHTSQIWQLHKPCLRSGDGVVTAQNLEAARAGAGILAGGGNAVDAAVATCFALGVCEPWMSGIGGGGYMLVHLAAEQKTYALDFNLISPAALDPGRYALVDQGADQDMFGWPKVVEDRNLSGYESICVPGAVDGLGTALERFGSMAWNEVLAPAIRLAEKGLAVDWFATLAFAHSARDLARFPSTRAALMPDGQPPAASWDARPWRLPIPGLAQTLKRLAQSGHRDFYEGGLAAQMLEDLQEGGCALSLADLSSYHARVLEPLSFNYGGSRVHTIPGLCGGPTLARMLGQLKPGLLEPDAPGPRAFAAYASALLTAYQERLATMGHGAGESCTSHLNVVDAKGDMVTLTNTLLARFGSRVLLPQSGIIMNNGMMWFDPHPGRPNSIAPGVRPLANMCPALLTKDGEGWLALGAAGGRQIVPAVGQIISLITDFGLSLEEALHQPRIDVSGPAAITYDQRLPGPVAAALKELAPSTAAQAAVFPVRFSVASAVMRDLKAGVNLGQADPYMPLSAALSGAAR